MSNRMAAIAALSSLIASIARASDDFRYFSDPEINYWKRSEQGAYVPPATVPTKPAASGSGPNKSFAWEKYLSPAHDEFFREGDYTPPAPFVEIARNINDVTPSDDARYGGRAACS